MINELAGDIWTVVAGSAASTCASQDFVLSVGHGASMGRRHAYAKSARNVHMVRKGIAAPPAMVAATASHVEAVSLAAAARMAAFVRPV